MNLWQFLQYFILQISMSSQLSVSFLLEYENFTFIEKILLNKFILMSHCSDAGG